MEGKWEINDILLGKKMMSVHVGVGVCACVFVCVHRYQLQSLEQHPKVHIYWKNTSIACRHQKEKSFGNILSNQV